MEKEKEREIEIEPEWEWVLPMEIGSTNAPLPPLPPSPPNTTTAAEDSNGNAKGGGGGGGGGGKGWTLRKLAAVFDALPERGVWKEMEMHAGIAVDVDKDVEVEVDAEGETKNAGARGGKKEDREGRGATKSQKNRDAKRILLPIVANRSKGGDGTVTYYIVQDGDVKPRQN